MNFGHCISNNNIVLLFIRLSHTNDKKIKLTYENRLTIELTIVWTCILCIVYSTIQNVPIQYSFSQAVLFLLYLGSNKIQTHSKKDTVSTRVNHILLLWILSRIYQRGRRYYFFAWMIPSYVTRNWVVSKTNLPTPQENQT